MVVKLNRTAFDFAKELIVAGRFGFDDRDGWSEHPPLAQTENEFIAAHGFREYAKWYLGINEEKHKNTKGHEFPYGDFENVHRCGVLTGGPIQALRHRKCRSAFALSVVRVFGIGRGLK
jgi:hypothetical protein